MQNKISGDNREHIDDEIEPYIGKFKLCPLCGKETNDGNPHKECEEREAYIADRGGKK